jgi:hypothetical protein
MRRLLALPLLALALTGCPSYDNYAPLVSQKGLVPPDQFARYGKEQAQAVAIGREFAVAYRGDTPADWAAQADAAIAYARTLPDVATIVADTLGHRLTVQFKSGWRTAYPDRHSGAWRGKPDAAAASAELTASRP